MLQVVFCPCEASRAVKLGEPAHGLADNDTAYKKCGSWHNGHQTLGLVLCLPTTPSWRQADARLTSSAEVAVAAGRSPSDSGTALYRDLYVVPLAPSKVSGPECYALTDGFGKAWRGGRNKRRREGGGIGSKLSAGHGAHQPSLDRWVSSTRSPSSSDWAEGSNWEMAWHRRARPHQHPAASCHTCLPCWNRQIPLHSTSRTSIHT